MPFVRNVGNRLASGTVWSLCALTVAIAGITLWPSAALAGNSPAQLVVNGPTPIQVELTGVPGKQLDHGQLHLLVADTGKAPTKLNFRGFLDTPMKSCSTKQITIERANQLNSPIIINPGATDAPILDMRFGLGCTGDNGTLVISGGAGVTPVTVRFTLVRNVVEADYWLPILISGGLALFFALGMVVTRRHVLPKTVQTGSSWSFKDSWLTNVSLLGAILGTVLATTGFLPATVPGISTAGFTGLSVLFGGFVIAAPLVYSAASKWKWQEATNSSPSTLVSPGRVWGVIAAAGLTLWGVFGELAALIVLTEFANSSGPAKAFVIAALSAAATLTAWYAGTFVIGVSKENWVDKNLGRVEGKSGTL